MKKEEKARLLFEGISYIDDAFVDEAEAYTPKATVIQRKFAVISALAACIAILFAISIGSMLSSEPLTDLPTENEQAPLQLTLDLTLAQASTPNKVIDLSSTDLLDGASRIVWLDTQSNVYYAVQVSSIQLVRLYSYNGTKNDISADSVYRIWLISPSGEVSSPQLINSEGNTTHGVIFTYDPELIVSQEFISDLNNVIN